MHSPMTSLYSDLYDMSLLGRNRKSRKEREGEIDKLLLSLKRLEENPICVFIDEKSSVFALAAFWPYCHRRRAILRSKVISSAGER